MTDYDAIKNKAKQLWSTFTPFETVTGLAAPILIKFSGVKAQSKVLDVGCGTGVVAITAARVGADVCGSDLTPELIERAKENSKISQLDVDFKVADVENLPYDNEQFDFVLSQFGHMFAPRPMIAIEEMLRVLKPEGTIAFSTWPPELLTGRLFRLVAKYAPPPEGVSPPAEWGNPDIVKERLGQHVKEIIFEKAEFRNPALSPSHMRIFIESYIGPVMAVVSMLQDDQDKLSSFRKEMDELLNEYFKDNVVVQTYLMTRAVKIS
tara:strand:- start:1035 stop:1829 length:795 start_codon:yes stop_codon:yes gene_type:complete